VLTGGDREHTSGSTNRRTQRRRSIFGYEMNVAEEDLGILIGIEGFAGCLHFKSCDASGS
jgi:hypothetical protein